MSLIVRRIEEHRVVGRPLGRHVAHDPKSREFPATLARKIRSVVHQGVGLPLNQADVGKCTCEALAGAKNATPNFTMGEHVMDDHDTDALYEAETALEGDPWLPSNPTVNDVGGSGLFVCRAAKHMGLIRSYRHAFGIEQALKALCLRPVIFGVDWYEGFDHPDGSGLVAIAGQIRGGHEICALEIDTSVSSDQSQWDVWFAQSWGLGYGVPRPSIGLPDGGAFKMKVSTVDQLLQAQGDATVPHA